MGFLAPKVPSIPAPAAGPSAEEIKAQEEAAAREAARTSLEQQEAARAKLRAGLVEEGTEEEIRRKRLFGE